MFRGGTRGQERVLGDLGRNKSGENREIRGEKGPVTCK